MTEDLIIGALDKAFYPNKVYGAATVLTAFKIVFGVADYAFAWGDTVEMIVSIRVAGALTDGLRESTTHYSLQQDYQNFLHCLKYLIKMRLVGEKTYCEMLKALDEKKAIGKINEDLGSSYDSVDEYFDVFRTNMLMSRDILYGEETTAYTKPEPPEVTIDYFNETTVQTFDSRYEYSFDGASWTDCDGTAIRLEPKSVGRHLWVRVKETEENLAGNITKIYVPERSLVYGDITVKYKDGTYYIDGLKGTFDYEFTDSDEEVTDLSQTITATEGTTITLKNDTGYKYLAIRANATNSSFKSAVRKILVENALYVTVLNDDKAGIINGAGEYFEGEEVTVRTEVKTGYEFDGWYQDGQLLTKDTEYSFYVYSDTELEARYKKIAEVTVTFKGWNGKVLSLKKYPADQAEASEITVPSVPTLSGYDFTGWVLDGVKYNSTSLIQKAVLAKFGETDIINVKAQYRQKEELYTVTVKNGTLSTGKTSGTYRPATQIEVRADKAPLGKKFAYWKKDGKTVGYEDKYLFYMPTNDTVLEAVFVNIFESVEKVGTTYIESVERKPEIGKISFVSVSSAPEGGSIEFAGVVATSDISKTTGTTGLTKANADYVRGGGAGYKTYKYTWTKGKVTEDQTWYVRPYLKYKDQKGVSHEIYGDLVKESLGVKVTFLGWNQKILTEDIYARAITDSSKIEIPSVFVLDGYKHVGWTLDGIDYDDTDIQEAIVRRFDTANEIVVQARFEEKAEKYKVTVVNGTLPGGTSGGEYSPTTLIIVTADNPESGKKFAHWEKDGAIVGYEKTYLFYMPTKDCTLTAVYQDDETVIAPKGTTYIENVVTNAETGKISFVSVSTVPDGCSIEMAGIVATSDVSKAIGGTGLTVSNADYVRGGGAGYKSFKYTWTKGKVTADQTWYVRAYLRYKDANGTVYETYGDLVTANLHR